MKALYTAATGMNAQTHRLDNIANNISNVNTTSYKRSTASFADLFYEELAVGGGEGETPAAVQIGGGVQLTGVVRDHSNHGAVCTVDDARNFSARKCDRHKRGAVRKKL